MQQEIKEEMKRYFEEHQIYPDTFNEEENKGFRPSYFYLHGKAEALCSFDCFNASGELMSDLLRQSVSIANMNTPDGSWQCLVFSRFEVDKMRGYATLIDDIKAIEDVLEDFPFHYTIFSDVEDWIKETYPETWQIFKTHNQKR